MTDPVDSYLAHLAAGGASAGTVRLRRGYLARLAGHVGGDLLGATPEQLVGFVGTPGWAPATRQSARASVRSFYCWAVEAGLLEQDPSRRLPGVRVPAGVPHPVGEVVLEAALAAADLEQTRMLLLGAFAGLRRAEIAAVHTSHLTPFGLAVTGKGGRQRVIPVHPLLRAALADVPAGWVFPSYRKPGQHVTGSHVYKRLRPLLGDASPHALRHRFATRAYQGTTDLLAVQRLLGHSKPETTVRYTQLSPDSLAAAVAAVG